jgi:S1-C subfamily serine protease
VEVEGAPIASNNDLLLALKRRAPGDTVELGVLRGGKRVRVRVVLDAYR